MKPVCRREARGMSRAESNRTLAMTRQGGECLTGCDQNKGGNAAQRKQTMQEAEEKFPESKDKRREPKINILQDLQGDIASMSKNRKL